MKLDAIRGLVPLDSDQRSLLDRFERWLTDEALPAGGIGPAEAEIVMERHIVDSLAFSLAFPSPPPTLVDIGSGAGLPGIPLAILWPATQVRLVDRSRRRTDLAARAIRVLGLPNATAETADVRRWGPRIPAFVARAVVQAEDWPGIARKILEPGGIGVVGITADTALPDAPAGLRIERIDPDVQVLDRPVSFLKMTACD